MGRRVHDSKALSRDPDARILFLFTSVWSCLWSLESKRLTFPVTFQALASLFLLSFPLFRARKENKEEVRSGLFPSVYRARDKKGKKRRRGKVCPGLSSSFLSHLRARGKQARKEEGPDPLFPFRA